MNFIQSDMLILNVLEGKETTSTYKISNFSYVYHRVNVIVAFYDGKPSFLSCKREHVTS